MTPLSDVCVPVPIFTKMVETTTALPSVEVPFALMENSPVPGVPAAFNATDLPLPVQGGNPLAEVFGRGRVGVIFRRQLSPYLSPNGFQNVRGQHLRLEFADDGFNKRRFTNPVVIAPR